MNSLVVISMDSRGSHHCNINKLFELCSAYFTKYLNYIVASKNVYFYIGFKLQLHIDLNLRHRDNRFSLDME